MTDEITADNPLDVVIAGGGVGGLVLAKALVDQGMKVRVFEKTSAFKRFGGPIQIASNALSTLNAIDAELFERLMEKFTFTGVRNNGIKDGIRTEWYCKFDAITSIPEEMQLPYTGVIDRPALQELLLQEVPENTVQNSVDVVGYELPVGGGVDVMTEDGERHHADVLVGADGIWSSVRAQMWNEPARAKTDASFSLNSATYSGYTVFAGETTFQTHDYFECGYKVYVGPKQYFVISDVGKGRMQWYAFLALPAGSKAREDNIGYLSELFEGWSHEIHEILGKTSPEFVEQRDLYDRPPQVLKSWSQGPVTLMGDACHPMMPNLGQGGCQAIEDAYVMSQQLSQATHRSQLPELLQQYYQKRIFRASIVQGLSRMASDFIILFFDTPCKLFLDSFPPRLENFGFLSVLIAAWRPLMPFIFKAQFSYLYSFAPKRLQQGELQRLTTIERARNKQEAEAAWRETKEGVGNQRSQASFLSD